MEEFISIQRVNGLAHFRMETPKTGTFASSEDPVEMPHTVALHLGLHCLLKTKEGIAIFIDFV